MILTRGGGYPLIQEHKRLLPVLLRSKTDYPLQSGPSQQVISPLPFCGYTSIFKRRDQVFAGPLPVTLKLLDKDLFAFRKCLFVQSKLAIPVSYTHLRAHETGRN